MQHVSACTETILRHVSTQAIQMKINLLYLPLLYLALYGLCIDMPEDVLSTGRNMLHRCRGNLLY